MSWGATINIIPGEGWEESNVSGMGVVEHRAQFQAAKEAVGALLNSGAWGAPTHPYKVMLSGHGNPNGEPVPGWSNDFVSIAVYQLGENQ